MASFSVEDVIARFRAARHASGTFFERGIQAFRADSYRIVGLLPRDNDLPMTVLEWVNEVDMTLSRARGEIDAVLAKALNRLVAASFGPAMTLPVWNASLAADGGVPSTEVWDLSPLTQQACCHVLEQMASVHRLPDVHPVTFTNVVHGDGEGFYFAERVQVGVRTSAAMPELTIGHELGHYYDHVVLGELKEFGSRTPSPQLAEWRDAVEGSAAIRTLREHRAKPDLDDKAREQIAYLLLSHELFARTYVQWIATRSDDLTMLTQLRQRREVMGFRKHAQWSAGDFAPIGAALDRLIGSR